MAIGGILEDKTAQRAKKGIKQLISLAPEQGRKGIVALSDTLCTTAESMVRELKQTHTDAVLLTGDHKQTADYFAEQVGINSLYANCSPPKRWSGYRNCKTQAAMTV